jgi:hypothetical protein
LHLKGFDDEDFLEHRAGKLESLVMPGVYGFNGHTTSGMITLERIPDCTHDREQCKVEHYHEPAPEEWSAEESERAEAERTGPPLGDAD